MTGGITGHQDLGDPSTVAWVTSEIGSALVAYSITEGITCLARGADQLFAIALRDRHVPYIAIIPCARYRETFGADTDAKRFDELLRGALEVQQLPFDEPSEVAFYEAGKRVAEQAEILIAVWNGRPARGVGGTADVVTYARAHGRRVVHINPETRAVTATGEPEALA